MMAGLVTFALAHLWGSWRRSAAAAAAILVAVSSFVILTGTVKSQKLQVTRDVANNYRSSYDILVRPRGSTGPLEKTAALVRPNFLSGQYGGISLEQVRQIAAIPGVEVAAPVAVLGQTMRSVVVPVDVGNVLGARDHAMVRFRLNGTARNSTAHTNNQNGYLYLTREPLSSVDSPSSATVATSPAQIEHRNGHAITACLASDARGQPTSPAAAFQERCWSARSPAGSSGSSGTPRVEMLFSLPLTVEAVDPAAEALLTGLDRATVQGRGLTENDSFSTDVQGPAPIAAATAVMASQLPFDFQAKITVDELTETTANQVLATQDASARRRLVLSATPLRTVKTIERDAAQTYRSDIVANVDAHAAAADQSLMVQSFTRPADVTYTGASPLSPTVVLFDPTAWRANADADEFLPAPSSVTDTGYRRIAVERKSAQDTFVSFRIVGTYDPERLPKPSRLNEVPLETYRASTLEGADAASRAVLGDKPMRPDLNPAGYVQSPPALLMSLKALPLFWKTFSGLDQKAPVSSVRIRVGGITGLDPVAREKIRQIADRIQAQTSLDVDITIGASLQNRRVALPATASGTPALLLNERWTKKGVAVAITEALDVKSLLLFILILASSALSVALIATASVAARRRELATLACLGWPAGRLGTMLAAELLILGLGAGTLGAIVSWPIAHALGISVAWWQFILAVPLGALLALLPGLAATVTASRIAPVDAFRPRPERRYHHGRLSLTGPTALGLIMTGRRPGRAALGSLAVALAVASAVLLATIVRAFNGAVVGSFLGDAVALQVRAPDIAATIIIAVLGLTAVATVLLLALGEDAPAFAALQATGWSDRSLALTLLTQAAAIGLLGALLGSGLALGATAQVIGPITAPVLAIAAIVAVAALAICAFAALLPALLIRRLPTAQILARE
jgi:putative ABC transport system permease protein